MEPTTHQLQCDGKDLAPGVRMERPWSCTCGVTFFGYDSTVRKAFAAHKREAQTK